MRIIDAIGSVFKAIANYFGWAQQRDAERNTPAMQANAAAQTEAKIDDKVSKAIDAANNGDPTEERKLAAE